LKICGITDAGEEKTLPLVISIFIQETTESKLSKTSSSAFLPNIIYGKWYSKMMKIQTMNGIFVE
jgi:hypothetical protein